MLVGLSHFRAANQAASSTLETRQPGIVIEKNLHSYLIPRPPYIAFHPTTFIAFRLSISTGIQITGDIVVRYEEDRKCVSQPDPARTT